MNEPIVTLEVGEEVIELKGTIKALKEIERKMKKPIPVILEDLMEAGLADTCMMFSVASGKTLEEVEGIMLELGLMECKWALLEFISVSLVPPSKRDETRKKLLTLRQAVEVVEQAAAKALEVA